jgi:hypothetical protein
VNSSNAPIFTAVQRFDPSSGDAWARYIEWSQLSHVTEIVTLDSILCPSVIEDLIAEDWKFNVQVDYRVFFFRDLRYLQQRVREFSRYNILAVVEAPLDSLQMTRDCHKFEFCGHDILDQYNDISLLTNCGGFSNVFPNRELNNYGLFSDRKNAYLVCDELRSLYPDDQHCQACAVWGIWRLVQPPK